MLNFLTTTTVCGFSLYHVLAFFLIYSCTGWCLEVIFAAATTGQLVNRGFLNGPVCPIYGFGMVIVLFTLTPLQNSVLLLYIGGHQPCPGTECPFRQGAQGARLRFWHGRHLLLWASVCAGVPGI